MEEESQVLNLYDLRYSDLVLSSSSSEEVDRLDSVRREVMEAVGPTGPGLLAISGVPNASVLRRHLPVARKLAFLDADHRKRILKVISSCCSRSSHAFSKSSGKNTSFEDFL